MLVAVWCLGSRFATAWTTEEAELYDLVEELGVSTSFYDILGVSPDASTSDIRRAFRTKSLELHPDKSEAEDAEQQFRNLVGTIH